MSAIILTGFHKEIAVSILAVHTILFKLLYDIFKQWHDSFYFVI